jgi:hypothetical protein
VDEREHEEAEKVSFSYFEVLARAVGLEPTACCLEGNVFPVPPLSASSVRYWSSYGPMCSQANQTNLKKRRAIHTGGLG